MKTILVNPPIRLPRTFAHYPTFSALGLLTNAAWLRKAGADVAVVDAFTATERLTLRDDGDGFRHLGAEIDTVVDAARAAAGDHARPALVLAVTMFSDLNRPSETLLPGTAAALREAFPHASIGLADLHVCGMNYFPWPVETILAANPAVDWALIGEGEPTLPALIERLDAGASLEGLPRVARRLDDGSVRYDPRAPAPFEPLDDLPLPAFDLLDMDRWFAVQADAIEADLVHEYHVVERQLPLMTSRGCPHRCSFCTNQVLGLPWRAHSVGWVRRAVRALRERWAIDRLLLLDDNINVRRDRFGELVRMLAEESMPWDAVNGFRADRLDRDAVRAIKAAGNTKITVSAESGDPRLLRKVIRKGLQLRSVLDLAAICREERVPLQVHYIVGVPGETREQINRTLELATELFEREGAWPLLQHAIPFPGTAMARECEERGWYAAPPETFSGAVLEERSIIRTPDFEPEQVVAMKRAAQHLHAAQQALTHLAVEARCDQDCVTCSCPPRRDGDRPARQALRRRMDDALFRGARELFLAGGEPTMRPDLDELVAEARTLGYRRVRLITNAHGLARPGRAEALLDAGVDGLVVALHGPSAEIHDAVTRTPGSWRLTLAGLERARRAGLDQLEVRIALVEPTLHTLAATLGLARRLGAARAHMLLPDAGDPAAALDLVPSWARARDAAAAALDQLPQGFATLQGAPLCLWNERPGALTPSPPWVLSATRPRRAKTRTCRRCTMLLLCGGFWRSDARRLFGVDAPPGLDDA